MVASLVIALLLHAPAGLGAVQGEWNMEQREADLRQLAAAVETEWSYFDHRRARGLDPEALLERSLAEVREAETKADFARVLRRYVSSLGDGHAWLDVPDVRYEPSRSLPFTLSDSTEGVVVGRVAEGVGRPRPGERVVSVGGIAIETAMEAASRMVFASTDAQRRHLALLRVRRARADAARCVFRSKDGQVYAVELTTQPGFGSVETPESRAPSVRWPRGDVAVLRVRTFAPHDWGEWSRAESDSEREPLLVDAKQAITDAIAEVAERDPRALVLDLRGNGGGTDLLGIHLAEHLLEEPFRYFLLSGRIDGEWTRPDGIVYGRDEPPARYAGPLYALVDAGCFSATDNLLRCLDDLHPDFVVVGRPTAGGTGAPRVVAELEHSGARVTLCTQRVRGPAGEQIEGRGTEPDLLVVPTPEEIAAGADVELRVALAHLDAR